ncbi:MAG: 50S ribosomal protein L21 [Candidatus Margulisbacteria bacterium]|nr:50S ribosomal protein L21 [Candidatus Margulisiibacteriota bacterium]
MYAIVEVAGKQYKVTKGLKLYVDLLNEDVDKAVSLDKVLFVKMENDIKVGMPYVEGASVEAVVKDPTFKDKKVIVFKFKNKTGYHKTQGHRQKYTMLEILDILTEGKKIKKAAKAEKEVITEQIGEKPEIVEAAKEAVEAKSDTKKESVKVKKTEEVAEVKTEEKKKKKVEETKATDSEKPVRKKAKAKEE